MPGRKRVNRRIDDDAILAAVRACVASRGELFLKVAARHRGGAAEVIRPRVQQASFLALLRASAPELLPHLDAALSRAARRAALLAARAESARAGAKDGDDADYCGPSPSPHSPCEALPGTEAKILVMQQRAAQGLALHHALDRRPDLGFCPSDGDDPVAVLHQASHRRRAG
jgi:hypothetical protein